MKNNKKKEDLEKKIVIQSCYLIICIIALIFLIFRFAKYLETQDLTSNDVLFPSVLGVVLVLMVAFCASIFTDLGQKENSEKENQKTDPSSDQKEVDVEEDPTTLEIYKASMRIGIVKYPEGFLFKSCKDCYHYIIQSDDDIKCCYHCDHGSNYIDDQVDINGGEYNGESTKRIKN